MGNRVETAWIMAEIEPHSFEPMRDSSQSEEDDVHESQDERRRENTSWCVCACSANWEGQQEKDRERILMLQGNRGSSL